ncbi:hypothetical protein Taro_011357 [Colocasia esculenta]|uniref:Exocyst subunit Exo70 family protein n=1 Tax=Colocasia esculenta TaxID=4460 RepID=A0A843U9R1_COLES|nr:hypothetical protein [Colocasia esculenta]
MPRKFGIRSLFFHRAPPSSAHGSEAAGPASPCRTFSATMMAENLSAAEEIITKWDPQASTFASITSIFYESRAEARQFLRAVVDLQHAMRFFMADSPVSRSALLVRAQSFMQAAMRRLQKEFYQILSANRDCLDPESVSARSSLSLGSTSSLSDLEDEEFRSASESIGAVERVSDLAMADLRSIAECMISCGYGKECVDIYKTIRRSIVDEGLYKLGFEKTTPAQVQKLLDWDILDIRIRNWLAASKVALRTLLAGERALCDHVFASSDSIRQSCFAEISREASVEFFAFPELVASKKKRSPERVFRILDMYGTIAELWPEIESVFSYETTSTVRSQANSSLLKLGDVVRSSLADFESAIQKDKSKEAAPGGGVHPLSRYVMNYLALLADYSDLLADIYADYPFDITTALPESFFDASTSSSVSSSPSHQEGDNLSSTPVSVRIAWLILVLLCKLDSKAELYQEVALAYLFLANNLRYVVRKVRGCKLVGLLGDDWTSTHEAKANGYAASYERLAWSKVLAAVPQDRLVLANMDAQAAREQMRSFNEAFEEAYRGQAAWVVTDRKMREELKLSIARKLMPAYRSFFERSRALLWGERDYPTVVRFTPEDLGNYISDFFYGDAGDGSSVSTSVSVSSSGSSKVSWRALWSMDARNLFA